MYSFSTHTIIMTLFVQWPGQNMADASYIHMYCGPNHYYPFPELEAINTDEQYTRMKDFAARGDWLARAALFDLQGELAPLPTEELPTDSPFAFAYGVYYLRIGRRDRARQYITISIQDGPTTTLFNFLLKADWKSFVVNYARAAPGLKHFETFSAIARRDAVYLESLDTPHSWMLAGVAHKSKADTIRCFVRSRLPGVTRRLFRRHRECKKELDTLRPLAEFDPIAMVALGLLTNDIALLKQAGVLFGTYALVDVGVLGMAEAKERLHVFLHRP